MQANEVQPLPIIDQSDVVAERFNDLLKVVQEQEQQIKRLEQRAQRCTCPACVVIGR